MAIIGFNSADDFRRANRAIRKVEGERVDLVQRRGRYPIGGGAGGTSLVPYIITKPSESGSEPNVAVYRTAAVNVVGRQADQPLTVWNELPAAVDEDLDQSLMRGVVFTNQVVLVARIGNSGSTTTLKIVGGWGGDVFHDCVTAEAIAAGDSGTITLRYYTNTTLELDGVLQEANVTATNSLDRGLSEGQTCDLVTFSDALQTFKIISASCG